MFFWNPGGDTSLSSIALPRLNHLTSNFNSVIFFENSHWPFNLDWLFEIRTDPGFVQNPIWGLRYYLYTDWSEKFVSSPRGSNAHWVNLSNFFSEDDKGINNFILICYLNSDYSSHFLLAILLSWFWIHSVIDQWLQQTVTVSYLIAWVLCVHSVIDQ